MAFSWDDRIRRAAELKREYPFAREVLEFYRAVAEYQKDLYLRLINSREGAPANSPGCKPLVGKGPLTSPVRAAEDSVVPPLQGSSQEEPATGGSHPWLCAGPPSAGFWKGHFRSFLSFVEQVGTPELAALAGQLLHSQEEDAANRLLESYWRGDLDADHFQEGPALFFFPKTFLQPYAERLVADDHQNSPPEHGQWRVQEGGRAVCPVCEHPPQLAILRPEGEGARRSLLCSLCATEWRYKRVCCPACGEQTFSKLSYSRAQSFPHIRVDLCESCKSYIKTIDQTIDGRAVPVVDEIAALPLDLWAVEQGYTKIELNLVGM